MSLELRTPERISATQLSTARACPLRFVLDSSVRGTERPLPTQSPTGYLGSVFHGVVEDARRGRAGNPPNRERLEECWRSRLVSAEASAREHGDEDWLPFAESYQRLERLRLRALRLAAAQRVRVGTGEGNPSTEAWVESTDGLVVGKIDAIDREGDQTILRDFKSGEVADGDGGPLAEHRLQMIVYAGLYHESRGRWPDHLELVGGSGNRVEVLFDPSEAIATLEESRGILRELHDAIGEGATIMAPEVVSLARPDGGVCRSCQHRPACPGHMRQLGRAGVIRLDDGPYPTVDAHGVIEDAGLDRDGLSHLVIRNGAACRRIRRVAVRSLSDRSSVTVSPGDVVAVFGAAPKRPAEVDPAHEQLVTMRFTRAFTLDLR